MSNLAVPGWLSLTCSGGDLETHTKRLSVLGIGLLLSHYGLSTYALPVLGKAYLDGVQNAVVLANTILLDGLTRSVLYVAFLLYSAGFILFGFGVWSSGA